MTLSSRRMFTIDAAVTARPLGEIPSGFRIDLQYNKETSRVSSRPLEEGAWDDDWPQHTRERMWKGLNGSVVSGNDWVTVYTNAVIRMNGRVTIAARTQARRPFLIDMLYSGVTDLAQGGDAKAQYERWRAGEFGGMTLSSTLAITFELAHGTESWARKEEQSPEADYARFARLVRAQYVALGTAQLGEGPYSLINRLHLTVHELASIAQGET
jgi:hypothetical protein